MAEGDGLENRCGCKSTVGSNPTLSARYCRPPQRISAFMNHSSRGLAHQERTASWVLASQVCITRTPVMIAAVAIRMSALLMQMLKPSEKTL